MWTEYLWAAYGLLGSVLAVTLQGLPATVSLQENSPAGTEVFCFKIGLSTGTSVVSGFPLLLNSNPLTNDFMVYMVNSTHAKVTVTGSPDLDFESSSNHFILRLLVVDNSAGFELQTLTVILTDVDEPPVFLDETSLLYIVEKSPPSLIYQPAVFDPENRPLTFALSPLNAAFSIDHSKGFLFTVKQLDYLTDPRRYYFNMSVNDGNNTSTKPLFINLINLNDDKPYFLNTITSFTIPEELSLGHMMANITAVVPSDSLYSSFIFYTISDNNYLAIHKYTGLVTIANRMDRDSVPLRDSPTITVTVTASFSPPGPPLINTINITVTVQDINDNPPICFADNQRREVPETEVKGALIATIMCTDNDVLPLFKEFIFTGLSCLGCSQLFALKTNQIILNGSLDYEDPGNLYTGNGYSLLITAVDKNDNNLKGDAFVYVTVTPVNEFAPMFHPVSYFYTISELLGSGVVIGSVNATDMDLPPTLLRYSIVSGGGAGGLRNIFHLDPIQGRITLLTHPDYEDTQTHVLIIRVVDGDPIRPRSATTTVVINVTEANDEPPVCGPNNTNLVVPVDLRLGTAVQGFTLSCTDRDSPPTSFIYSISGASNVNNHFGFSPSAGSNMSRLILVAPFGFSSGLDTQWSYRLTALISDANLRSGYDSARAPPQTGTVIINVRVVDPQITTVITTTTPRVTYINVETNTFNTGDWYVWFVLALGSFLLLLMLAYLLYKSCMYFSTKDCHCCEPTRIDGKEELITDRGSPMQEVLMEVTKVNTVFDREEVDPVTKRVYEYNSKSGARRWKDAIIVCDSAPIQPESSTLVISDNTANAQSSPRFPDDNQKPTISSAH
ncbi:cadherin-related family member 3 isoform X2 [Pangasianodon hypophthalmus]|uniref:cadherin-related family member 3 isoform X2 n=1 Tax=Pangasianodon hypophthalmus TaxID=310915 RepID=UPI002308331F|nr:cadherin-related family member 3 isoform X2 [Pangasianodon hypophthalmus]